MVGVDDPITSFCEDRLKAGLPASFVYEYIQMVASAQSSRDIVLSAVRQAKVVGPDLPNLNQEWTTYPDAAAKFAEMLASVGGRCVRVSSLTEALADLESLPAFATAKQIVSLVPGLATSTLDISSITDPHDLQAVDFAILPGHVAVAENAAVWVTDKNIRHRVLYFLTQHLALVVPSAGLVSNMHQGYDRIQVGTGPFAAWISGPSKTADIEQSLVIGAHGARITDSLLARFPVVPSLRRRAPPSRQPIAISDASTTERTRTR